MSALLLHAWLERGWLARCLWPLSLLYATLLVLRRTLYRLGWFRTQRLPVPVLVVGNVVVGGAGKTPTVIAIVRHLQARGWQPGVISRGHGRSSDGCREVAAGDTGELSGDEPALIAQATQAPVFVGRDRHAAGLALLKRHPGVNLIVSDDGMQHLTLARDLTVVVFDDRDTGNGWLLPAGMLREPWPAPPWQGSGMLVLRSGEPGVPPITRPSPYPEYAAWRRLSPFARDMQGRTVAFPLPQDRPLAALAGIARPQRFFDMLEKLGLRLDLVRHLPDHASAAELLSALDERHLWLCTEKDATKLFPALKASPLRVLAVPLEQTPEPGFFMALDQALDRLSFHHGQETA